MPRRAIPDPSIGERIKMRRKLRGWSIRYAASRAGIAHTTWSRIEQGKLSADNRFILSDIAQALECPIADLAGSRAMVPARPDIEAGRTTVHRISAALVEADLQEEPTGGSVPLGNLAERVTLLMDLHRRCDYTGIGTHLPDTLRTLHAAAAGPDREAALRLMVPTAFVASVAVRYLGNPGESWLGGERCRQAAEALEDPVLLALADYERAHIATACGVYVRGLRLATRAADSLRAHLDRPSALPTYGQLLLTCAFATLGVNRRLEDTSVWLTEAAEIAERTGQTSDLGLYFGPTNIAFWRVSMETDSGEPGRAVELARRTNPALVESPSRQVAFYCDAGRALARLRKDQEAVRMLVTAERMAPVRVHGNVLVREAARFLLDQSRHAAAGRELRALCERMGVT